MLRMPDFRAIERTFQLITQVSGRAGRRAEQGKVYIQTYSANHPVIQEIIQHQYNRFYQREMYERQKFHFPPYLRIIELEIKHKDLTKTIDASKYVYQNLFKHLGKRVSEPIVPSISRIRNLFIRQIVIKLEKDSTLIMNTKKFLMNLKEDLSSSKEFQAVKIKIDVDPY
jgi:primosomal protein N' (replication factor Y)